VKCKHQWSWSLPSGVNTFKAVLQALGEANFLRGRIPGHELTRVKGRNASTLLSFMDVAMVKSSPYLQAARADLESLGLSWSKPVCPPVCATNMLS